MSLNVLGAVKFVASAVVGIGAGKIITGIIKNNVTPSTKIDKVTIAAATWVISGIVSTASKKYTDESIDETVENVMAVVESIKVHLKLVRINNGKSTFEDEGLDKADFELKNTKKKDGTEVPLWYKTPSTKAQTDAGTWTLEGDYWVHRQEDGFIDTRVPKAGTLPEPSGN